MEYAPHTIEDAYHEWQDDLLAVSLKGETLWRMRVEDGPRISMVEPIKLDRRLRDIIQLDDGRFAILTGAHTLIFIRDPKAERDPYIAAREPFRVAGYTAIASLEDAGRSFEAEYPWGQLLFQGNCSSCHRMDGQPGAAPPLNGIVGETVGSYPGYPYSTALAESGKSWTKARLNRYMEDPQSVFPGSSMPGINHLESHERRKIVDYLAGTEPVVPGTEPTPPSAPLKASLPGETPAP